MSLKLYYHPLSSYCWKALIGLYETGTVFEPVLVNLGDPAERAAFLALWPIGKFPVLEDNGTGEAVPESSIILEGLDRLRPGAARLVPADPEAARRTRLWDRIFDLHVHDPMQRIVGDRIRPEGAKDPFGVEQARTRLAVAYDLVEREAAKRSWFSGDGFGMADCAAFPALFYADKVQALGAAHPATLAYLDRLKARPSVARVLKEAEPYFHMFPG